MEGPASLTHSGRHIVRGTSTITITDLEIYLLLHLSVCSKMQKKTTKKKTSKLCDHNMSYMFPNIKTTMQSKAAEHN